MVTYKDTNRYKSRDLPRTDSGLRRGQTAFAARHSPDPEERAKAKEALRRAHAERLDPKIRKWTADGKPVRDDDADD